ncbi:peptide methionine sulfoxide reductase MsrA [Bacillus sp. JCM 19045]|nr:peptide methionine sulfoxide reductase MsrA [Bacillus sp. JCM 19045]
MEIIYFAGGCLWGVQAFMKTVPGVIETEAGRANGTTKTLAGPYDGYAECVKTEFDPSVVSVEQLMSDFFEIIDRIALINKAMMLGRSIEPVSIAKEANTSWQRRHLLKREMTRSGLLLKCCRCRIMCAARMNTKIA